MKRIVVLVSGGGTNLQALLDARGSLGGEIVLVAASKAGVGALARAQAAGVPTAVLPAENREDALLNLLSDSRADLVVLAGFLSILGPRVVSAYAGRIINVHPALLPAFGGRGYYGLRVHQAALARGVKLTGASVHFVNETPDGGPIILQRAVEVLPDDTPETLQRRVMEQAEWRILPQAVSLFCAGRLRIEDDKVIIERRGQDGIEIDRTMAGGQPLSRQRGPVGDRPRRRGRRRLLHYGAQRQQP